MCDTIELNYLDKTTIMKYSQSNYFRIILGYFLFKHKKFLSVNISEASFDSAPVVNNVSALSYAILYPAPELCGHNLY